MALFPYSILQPEEIVSLDINHEMLDGIPKDFTSFGVQHRDPGTHLELYRPFLGEDLWFLFWLYRVVALRMAFRVTQGIEKKRQLPEWDDDSVIELLRTRLSEDEITFLRKQKIAGPQRTLELLELKILREAEARISGTHAGELSLKGSLKIIEELGRIKSFDPTRKR